MTSALSTQATQELLHLTGEAEAQAEPAVLELAPDRRYVMVEIGRYQALSRAYDEQRMVERALRGIEDGKAGRVRSLEESRKQAFAKHGIEDE